MSSGVVGTKGVPRQEREQQIVAVAVDEFARNGYARASMVAIASGAGISKPLIYQYFGSKDGLVRALLLVSLRRRFRASAQPARASSRALSLGA